MDPRLVPDRPATERGRGGPAGVLAAPALPSRAEAIAECRRALADGRGPALLTGEAGSGKTWAWRRLAAESGALGRWIGLDVAPTDDGIALLRRALRAIGRLDAEAAADPRVALAEELSEQAEDGRRWALVLDEAQNASDAALEEFRLLSNRLGRPDGFAALLLVGRTGLAFRLRGRAWESLDARLAGLVRLGPIDADEAEALLAAVAPGRAWDSETVEALHTRAMGNPARLIRLADRLPLRAKPSPSPRPAPPAPEPPRGRPASAATNEPVRPIRTEPASPTPPPPALVEARPPLRFEDGLIEVGWAEADDLSAEAAPDEWPGRTPSAPMVVERPAGSPPIEAEPAPSGPTTEAIPDPYATIQARAEWVRAVRAAASAGAPGDDGLGEDDGPSPAQGPADEAAGRRLLQVRAEAGQEFAPYSRLFSQMNSASDAE